MSNRYWGYGKEDDDLYLRLKKANIQIYRPSLDAITTGKKYTFSEKHGANRVRDRKRFPKQKAEALVLEPSGLNNLQYSIRDRRELSVDGYSCSVIDVELFCDRMDTHWCSLKYQFDN